MRVLLLHNPDAGTADHDADDLVAALAGQGLEVSYCSTHDGGFPDCLSGNFDALVIAGGDGTVAKGMKQLPDRRRPVAIVPLGGSNNVATSLRIGRDSLLRGGWPAEAALRDFHIGRVRGPWDEMRFVEGVGFGALAESIDIAEPDPKTVRDKLENGRRSLLVALAGMEPADVDLSIDGEVVAGRWLMVEALTVSHSGPRLPLADDSRGLAGQMSIVLLPEERRSAMLAWLEAPDRSEAPLRVIGGRRVSFRPDRDLPLRIDDSTASGAGHRIELEVDAEPLRMLVPERSPAAEPSPASGISIRG